MTKENTQVIIAKQKKRTRIICYVSLFFLVILLFLPPALRLFVEDKEPEEKKVITILTCNKADATISSTFLNDVHQNIVYKINGNYTMTNTGETLEVNNADEQEINSNVEMEMADDQSIGDNQNSIIEKGSFLELIRPISQVTYDDASNITTFRVNMNSLKEFSNYETDLSSIAAEEAYFATFDFSCAKEIK